MMGRIKAEVANIIVEKAIRGEKTPLWIRVLFPHVAEEVEPIARMLAGTFEPKPQTTSCSPLTLWSRLAATTVAIAIIIVGLWIGLPHHTGTMNQPPPSIQSTPKAVERALPPTGEVKALYTGTTATTASTASQSR